MDNLCVACSQCNLSKSDTPVFVLLDKFKSYEFVSSCMKHQVSGAIKYMRELYPDSPNWDDEVKSDVVNWNEDINLFRWGGEVKF